MTQLTLTPRILCVASRRRGPLTSRSSASAPVLRRGLVDPGRGNIEAVIQQRQRRN